MDFVDLGLSKELLKAVAELGFEEPSPIQALAVPLLLGGRDLVGQAQTGTGKTAAFGWPVLQGLNLRSKKTQALVLCPTRELAVQVAEEITSLAAHMRGVSVLPVYGGQSLERQLLALSRGVQLVVGTPGRVLDHLERGTLKLEALHVLVLDEADEMLDMGFREDIEKVVSQAPEECQKICFSATMPKAILDLARSYMRDPEFLRAACKEVTVSGIAQSYYEVKQYFKTQSLCLLLDMQEIGKGIVFCATKRGVDDLTTHLLAHGYQADSLHGNLSQGQRERVLGRFRSGQLDLLVATDVAARGLDIDDVELVINFDVPFDVENYVHRVGRTGRAGKSGRAITFVTPREVHKMREIIRYTKADIQRAVIPSKREVSDLKTVRLQDEIRETADGLRAGGDSGKVSRYSLLLHGMLDEETGYGELAEALLKMVIDRDHIWPTPAELDDEKRRRQADERERNRSADFGERPGDKPGGRRAGKGSGQGRDDKRGDSRHMERLFFNLGSKGRVTPGDFVGAITGETGLPGRVVGNIEIHEKFSFVEVPKEYAEEIMKVMNKAQIRGMRVAVDIARPQD